MTTRIITITEDQILDIPDTIDFGHVTYTVHTDASEIVCGDEPVDPDAQAGATIHAPRQIWLQTEDSSLEQVQNTLLHEVLHVCLNVSGAQYALESLSKSANVEEAYVSALTTPLHGVLMDNHDLVAFLNL